MSEENWLETGVEKIKVRLIPCERRVLGTFIDCNMSSAWVGDTFRIFPGKYGEDPVWGDGAHLKIGEGKTVSEAFSKTAEEFISPKLPPIAPRGELGLHGAIWFETIYQDPTEVSGKTLYALYHNENYPETIPYDSKTGKGLSDRDWPPGLLGDNSIQAVPRIGIALSLDGGDSWINLGLLLEDGDDRMIRLPVNRNYCFPGGVGDPSAVAFGEYLYVFFGEYSYGKTWSAQNWSAKEESSAQCISVARISLDKLSSPNGEAKRWDGNSFSASWDQAGQPIISLQIPTEDGGGPVSQGTTSFHWGPSVSWNEDLECWIMLMGRVDGPFWVGESIYLSVNPNRDLGLLDNSQAWSKPLKILTRPGHTLWYPSIQPMDSREDLIRKRTSLKLGNLAQLWFKDMYGDSHEYISDFILEFKGSNEL